MTPKERRQARGAVGEVRGWVRRARKVVEWRSHVSETAQRSVDAARHLIVDVPIDGSVAWKVLPMDRPSRTAVGSLAQEVSLPAVSEADGELLAELTGEVSELLDAVRAVGGLRRLFSGREKRDSANAALTSLASYRDRAVAAAVPAVLDRLEVGVGSEAPTIDVAQALSDEFGLAARLGEDASTAAVVATKDLGGLAPAVKAIARALEIDRSGRAVVEADASKVRIAETRRLLSEMPVERLRDTASGPMRLGAVTAAGIRTIQDVLDSDAILMFTDGVGDKTKDRIRAAALTLRQITFDETPVRIDIESRTPEATELLRSLGAWDSIRRALGDPRGLFRAVQLRRVSAIVDSSVPTVVVFSGTELASALCDSVRDAIGRARTLPDTRDLPTSSVDPWDDFFTRPADYYAILSELGILTEGQGKEHGDLPDEIIDAIRATELRGDHLLASLRGYQSFGARFAIVQRKVILGDEMGLGKTVEALAVLAHLRATGDQHFLVVCPAAVVTNWMREIASKSKLRPYRVHGDDRELAAYTWSRYGGVAVTTFETLGWLNHNGPEWPEPGCVVVDEAHYIKNPHAQRTQRTLEVLDLSRHAILLTGTPMENRIGEFANLVSYLRPDLVVDANELAPRRFRAQVAPAYLRRNQEDVLTELPDLVEVNEWLGMTAGDSSAYRAAVGSGNFMAMRQVAMLQSESSAKVQRLLEIVEEAEDNGRRVIVYSYFREVLGRVAGLLPGEVFGPITGSVPANKRQEIVDRFSAASGGAVLVAQIQAGGVGLNIQAASVVVICEPQLKPTTEWQAIARARRMGQLNSVQVHRLLSEGAVDERIVQILRTKSLLFDEFARISETADAAPEALDISEAELARRVVAAERERLFGAGASASALTDVGDDIV